MNLWDVAWSPDGSEIATVGIGNTLRIWNTTNSEVMVTAEDNDNILVNSACPGWVRTDLGGHQAPVSSEQGADTPVWLATLPDNGPSGGFFRDREQIAW